MRRRPTWPPSTADATRRRPRAILEDPRLQLVVSAAIPSAFTTLEQLAEARRVQAEMGRIYSVCFSERFENAATVRAGELVRAGAIGKVVQTIGLGPHRLDAPSRPA